MGKVRLFVRVREQGCRIESVPLRRLVELSGFRKRRWDFEDGRICFDEDDNVVSVSRTNVLGEW